MTSRACLCVRAGGLGDVLLLRPAIAALRAAGYAVWLLAPRRHASALLSPEGIAGVIDWDSPDVATLFRDGGHDPRDLAGQLGRFSGAVVYSNEERLVRAIGHSVARTVALSPLPPDGVHAAAWYTQAVSAFAPHAVEPAPCRPTADEERRAEAAVEGLPPRFLAIHAGSGSPRKNWPQSRFAAVAEQVTRGAPWLLIEGPAEAEGESVLRRLPGARVARGLSPRTLGAVLARAGGYVGNDSGVTHLAAAWGTPTIALFGPTDPRQWAPLGRQVRVLRGANGTLAEITVDCVLDSLAALRGVGRP